MLHDRLQELLHERRRLRPSRGDSHSEPLGYVARHAAGAPWRRNARQRHARTRSQLRRRGEQRRHRDTRVGQLKARPGGAGEQRAPRLPHEHMRARRDPQLLERVRVHQDARVHGKRRAATAHVRVERVACAWRHRVHQTRVAPHWRRWPRRRLRQRRPDAAAWIMA